MRTRKYILANKIKKAIKKTANGILFLVPLFSLLLSFNQLCAQATNSVSITASAKVIPVAEIEIVTIKDMQIDLDRAENGIITIAPLNDTDGGVIMLKGKPNASFKIAYLTQTKLENTAKSGFLFFEYQVFGYPGNNQQASEPIDAIERVLIFNSEGIYYIWVGGKIDIRNATPGNYEGEFTIEIEYC